MWKLSEEIFARKASGMVRTVSFTDILIYDFYGATSIGNGISVMLLFMLVMVPNADSTLAMLLNGLILLPAMIAPMMMGLIMPRSGGDYIYNSRVIHPLIGFVSNFSYVIWMTYFMGWMGFWFGANGVSSLSLSLGLVLRSSFWLDASLFFSTLEGIWISGFLIITFYHILAVLPVRRFFDWQKIAFIIGMVGLVAAAAILAMTPREAFITRFNSVLEPYAGPDYYQTVIQTSKDFGFGAGGLFSWKDTLLYGLPVVGMIMGYTYMSQYMGGEIKRVERSQLAGAIVGILACTFGLALMTPIVMNTAGVEFMYAAANLSFLAPYDIFSPALPFFNTLAAIMTDNIIVVAAIGVGFLMWFSAFYIVCNTAVTRCIFAWAMDRLVPTKLADINKRFHTPHYAVLISYILSIFFLTQYTYAPWLIEFSGGMLGVSISVSIMCISAIVIPFVLKEVYETSPIKKFEISGVPLISVFGIIGLIIWGVQQYAYLTYSPLGANSIPALSAVAAIFVIGMIIFVVAYLYRKHQGIDLAKTYKEIPPV